MTFPAIPDPARPVGRLFKNDVLYDLNECADQIKPLARAVVTSAIGDGRIAPDQGAYLLELVEQANSALRRVIATIDADWIDQPAPHLIQFPSDTIVIPHPEEPTA